MLQEDDVQVSCFVFLHMQKLLPSPLSSLFVLNSDCHQYLTRQKDNLHLHTHKYSFYLRVQGSQIWNDIPLSLRARRDYKLTSLGASRGIIFFTK